MATTNQTLSDLEISVASQLIDIHKVIKMSAFAAEARRILNDTVVACEVNGEFAEMLSEMTTAHNEWVEHDDNLGEVLKHVCYQLQGIINQITTSVRA